MEIKILRRYDYRADIEIDGVIYKGVYPIGVDSEHWGLTNDSNKIIAQFNIPEELQKKKDL